jgi:hypothetical protein
MATSSFQATSGLRVPVDPRYMDLRTWANFLVQDFGNSMLPILLDEDRWKEWAMRVYEAPAFCNAGAPQPQGFSDWRPWAERIVGLSIS